MGLDMYLHKKIEVWGKYEHRKVMSEDITITIGDKAYPINTKDIDEISIEVAYWRKANAIHNWFVTNIQDGNDDCKSYYIDIPRLKGLRKTCQDTIELLDSNSYDVKDLPLQPQSGFFFGSTDIDEHYRADIERTIKLLDNILATNEDPNIHYEYSSSW